MSAAFEAHRAAVWRGNRIWLLASALLIAAAALLAATPNAPSGLQWALGLAAAALSGITVARIVRGLDSLYRCPNCGTLPYQTLRDYKCGGLGPTRRDFMSPTVCPKCGTRLR
ncbi:MAG TPA: hypothetical protein VFB20_15540 [Burkholderiales bacterium]|nr:hypothetical protein [Burkholderiales bacterium]